MNSIRVWLIVLGTAIIASILLAITPLQPPAVQPSRSRTQPRQIIYGIGYAEPVSEIRRLMFNESGLIEQCGAQVGQMVKQGEILARLHSETEQAALAAANEELQLALAERDRVLSGIHPARIRVAEHEADIRAETLRHARNDLARIRRLQESNAATDKELEDAETAVRQAEDMLQGQQEELKYMRGYVRDEDRLAADAHVKVAQARAELSRRRLDDKILRAPFDGTVLSVLLREGEGFSILEPRPVLLLADLSRLRVRAEIGEQFVHDVKLGMKATVTPRHDHDVSYEGTVAQIRQLMGPKTLFSGASDERKDLAVFEVLIDVASEFHVPAGLQVDVTIHLR